MELHHDQLDFVRRVLGQEDLQSHALAGDASSRRYYRIVSPGASSVLMVWDAFADPDQFPFLSVQRHLKKHGVTVPEVLGVSPTQGLILLEDLGDLTLERKFWENQDQRISLPFYKQAIDELIKIHFSATADTDQRCSAFHIAFNHERLLWELNYGRKHLIEGLARRRLTAAQSALLDDCFDRICRELDRETKYIVHRDYHSRNVMLKLGQARVIDFQDARLGPVQYDLVSLFCDSYVDIEQGIVDELKGYYLESAAARGVRLLSERFDEVYDLQTLQRCFKACGSFASFFNMRNDRRYLKYLTPTLRRIHRVAMKSQRFREFGSFLEDAGLLDLVYERG
jgi:aminoglycoside/choline kinase family phosphotransferase